MAACTPLLFAGLQGFTVGLIDASLPVGLATDGGIIHTVILAARTMAVVADTGGSQCFTIPHARITWNRCC